MNNYIYTVNNLISVFNIVPSGKSFEYKFKDSEGTTIELAKDDMLFVIYKDSKTINIMMKVINTSPLKLDKEIDISNGVNCDDLDFIDSKIETKLVPITQVQADIIKNKILKKIGGTPAKKIVSASTDIEKYNRYLTTLKTKPFMLLAGMSGTGKSRLVRELAFATCPNIKELRSNPSEPGNYCLIDVKPNWHDSSELLGYYSNISGRYDITPFIRFVYKAILYPEVPFFVCLDEMNLAPVEQYFAEFLSKLETRKIKNDKNEIVTLIDKGIFSKCQIMKSSMSTDYVDDTPSDLSCIYGDDMGLMEYLKENGLNLPYNLYIIGTVNMDDTTHQFSRKVIDRAFTIEMNGGNLSDMFTNEDTLDYRLNPIDFEMLNPEFTDANSVLEAMDENLETKDYSKKIKEVVPKILNEINEKLDGTPFKVSYRVQNEMILYISSLLSNNTSLKIDDAITIASLAILLQKILPRVEGDDKLLGGSLDLLSKYINDNFNKGENGSIKDLYNQVDNKLKEMKNKLKNTYFTSFFS